MTPEELLSVSGDRLVGPHGGLLGNLPTPTDADLIDPMFLALWRVMKTWDVNVPEYYRGYCGVNGCHVMLVLNEIRKHTSSGNPSS